MFEALEAKFEGTNQADLIKGLYEGKPSQKNLFKCLTFDIVVGALCRD